MVRTIVTTAAITASVLLFISTIFYQSILGLFGLTAASVTAIAELRQAKHVVEQLKKKHDVKKNAISSRYIKKAGKRAATSAITALTIGTAGVVTAVVSFEAINYCEERKELQEDENILNGSNQTFSIDQCFEEAKSDFKRIAQEARADISKREPLKDWAGKWDKLKDSALSQVGAAKDYVARKWEETAQVIRE
jgi:hypothetical protein